MLDDGRGGSQACFDDFVGHASIGLRTEKTPAPDRLRARQERFEREALPPMRQLYATAYRLTRNAADAEDLVQETYLRAFRAFDGYTPDTNIRAWLFTILSRTRTDQLRKIGRSPKAVELPEEGPGTDPPQDALAGGQEEVARAVQRLPEVFRTAVLLRDVQDFTYEEIAGILGIPIGTVMSRIHRGRALLRRALQRPEPPRAPERSDARLFPLG
jgi:RNA polymerase sigma-70 factor (ECF subfamily)